MKNILGIFVYLALGYVARAEFVEFAGCTQEDYVVVNEANAEVLTAGFAFSPKCLKVAAGTQVTVAGSGFHPVQGVQLVDQPANPLVADSARRAPQTHDFTEAGVYGYFCVNHGRADGGGMAGAIWVVE